ncbi:MAG: adenylate/guanylate cyclase domain-containing protein [Xanthobacteraceae bacterium]|nr:adenylate/guanylate cyclase domain-containing protein [Xanthobacteraceae bacterium]
MAEARAERRLAAILATDVVGYSRLMGSDEEGTLAALKSLRKSLIDPKIAEYRGRIFKTTGDGALVEFASTVDAVRCAIDIQRAMPERNADTPPGRKIEFRIGINVGDIIVDGDDIFGDGVNVAARLESISEPGGICISDVVHQQVSGRVEALFADLGDQNLKNITRPVRAYRVALKEAREEPAAASTPTLAAFASPDKPSIAVLPFQNMSGDSEQDYFCDGLVEDIITTLSKLAGLRVIARNSSFVYKGRAVDIREAAKQLGVRYVLEGSVRKSGNRIRITAQLIDAKDGAHLWAERYDRTMDEIFAIQDEITLVLATEMQVKLIEGEQARLHYTTTNNVEAWTYWVQGMSHFHQAVSKEKMGAARIYWEKALALDPASAALNAMLGFIHCLDARFGWWDDHETAMDKARAYSAKALEIDPDNAEAHTASSLILLMQRRYDEAVTDARKAIQLAPGSALAADLASFVFVPSGYPEEGVLQSEKAIALSPHYPPSYLGTLGNAYRLAGRTEQAIATFKAYHARNPGFGLTDLVIIYQQIGQADEARRTVELLMAARPNFTIGGWLKTQFIRRDTAQVEADREALRAAGLPMG